MDPKANDNILRVMSCTYTLDCVDVDGKVVGGWSMPAKDIGPDAWLGLSE